MRRAIYELVNNEIEETPSTNVVAGTWSGSNGVTASTKMSGSWHVGGGFEIGVTPHTSCPSDSPWLFERIEGMTRGRSSRIGASSSD